jgi:excisionase family DNA binding protein
MDGEFKVVATPHPRMLLRAEEIAEVLGIGRSTVYDLMRTGRLRSVKIGGCRRVSTGALAEFVAVLEQEWSAA